VRDWGAMVTTGQEIAENYLKHERMTAKAA
jgi:hypothetical protein